MVYWLEEVHSKDVIWDSVLMLWTIWCVRNDDLFRNDPCNVVTALARFAGLKSNCRVEEMMKAVDCNDSAYRCSSTEARGVFMRAACFQFMK